MTPSTMSNLTYHAAQRFGDRRAITMVHGQSVRFSELDILVGHFAGILTHRGVKRGERVVLYAPNGLDWIIAYHAIARIAAVVVPANILLSASEVAFITKDSGARLVITSKRHRDALNDAIPKADRAEYLLLDAGEEEAGLPNLRHGPSVLPQSCDPEDLLAICYTSGTTGQPKGAMTTHKAVIGSTAATATTHVRTDQDRILTALPFPHVYGNVVMNASLLAGSELLIMERFDPAQALAAIESHRATLFEGVPTMYYQMLGEPTMANTDFSSLQRCTVGGQTMPVSALQEVEARFGCPVLELWGMTELAGPAVTHSPYWPVRHGTIGLPFPGMQVRIVSLDGSRSELAPGVAGELCIRGPLVTKGYWRRPEATAEAIDADGWLATGDVAIADEGGYLQIVDRLKDMIITAGYNIYPAELEQAIAAHPAVAMVAVASVKDDEKGELAKAFVVLRPGMTCSADELLSLCRQSLASYKVPRLIAFVDDLPKTSTGKIMRRSLVS